MDEKEDDDISIDFSRIKKFFSAKVKAPAEFSANQKKSADESADAASGKKENNGIKNESKDDDISIDFKKIKNFFKGGGDNKFTFAGKDEEDVPINWGKLIDFFKTYGVLFLVLIPVITPSSVIRLLS